MIEEIVRERSNNCCELCESKSDLEVFEVVPTDETAERNILICGLCANLLRNTDSEDTDHWRCLNSSAWSPVPAVQVVAYRQLKKLSNLDWAKNLLESIYLEPEILQWAESEADSLTEKSVVDSNGTALASGDSVTIIKDLNVKGAGFTAKRGTTVKNISLGDDPTHIEGRVNGVRIMLKTCFLKKLS